MREDKDWEFVGDLYSAMYAVMEDRPKKSADVRARLLSYRVKTCLNEASSGKSEREWFQETVKACRPNKSHPKPWTSKLDSTSIWQVFDANTKIVAQGISLEESQELIKISKEECPF